MRLQRAEVTWSQLRVGIFVLVCSAILLWGFIFAGSGLKALRNHFTVYTILDSASGLKPGDAVRLAGIEVGQVNQIEFIDQGGANKVRIHIRMSRKAGDRLRSDSTVQIESIGFTENRYIEVSLGTAKGSPITNGVTLAGIMPIEMPLVLNQAITVSESMNRFLNQFEGLADRLQSGEGTFSRLLRDAEFYENLNQTVHGTSQVVNTLNNGQGLIPQLLSEPQIAENVTKSTASLATVGQQMTQGEGTLGKLNTNPALFDQASDLMTRWDSVLTNFEERLNRLDSVIAQMDTTLQKAHHGEGTVAQLINTPNLHNQVYATSKKMEQFIEQAQSGEGTVGRLITDPSLAEHVKASAASIDKLTAKLNTPENTLDKLATGSNLLDHLQETMNQLESISTKINNGEGSLGKLTNDDQTAEALSRLITNLKELAADMQANPKKYVRFSLF